MKTKNPTINLIKNQIESLEDEKKEAKQSYEQIASRLTKQIAGLREILKTVEPNLKHLAYPTSPEDDSR
jgi:esterase/lipase